MSLQYLISEDIRQEEMQLYLSDCMWLLSCGLQADKKDWRPYRERIGKKQVKKDDRTAEQIKEDTLAGLKKLVKKGGKA